jgi:phosphoglycolate phosphatase
MTTLLLFDIDGTLLRAGDTAREAFDVAFLDVFGVENAMRDARLTTGRTDPEIFQDVSLSVLGRRLLDEEYERLADRYIAFLSRELGRSNSFRLMPGVEQLVTLLSARPDVILGLETGNLKDAAKLKLERGGIEQFFTVGGFGSDSTDRAEIVRIAIERARNLHMADIPRENIFIIGDAPQDIIAGRQLGISTLAVCTGRTDRDALMDEGPSRILPDLSDIQAFMQYVGL